MPSSIRSCLRSGRQSSLYLQGLHTQTGAAVRHLAKVCGRRTRRVCSILTLGMRAQWRAALLVVLCVGSLLPAAYHAGWASCMRSGEGKSVAPSTRGPVTSQPTRLRSQPSRPALRFFLPSRRTSVMRVVPAAAKNLGLEEWSPNNKGSLAGGVQTTDHKYTGHNYIGHNHVGHNYVGHGCAGHN